MSEDAHMTDGSDPFAFGKGFKMNDAELLKTIHELRKEIEAKAKRIAHLEAEAKRLKDELATIAIQLNGG